MSDPLLAEYLPRMYRVALRHVGDADKAEEVVQNACVKALQHSDQFAGEANVTTWLHRITVNCSIDMLRGNGRAQTNMTLDEIGGFLEQQETNPSLQAERRELQLIAEVLVGELPAECRTAFILTQMDGYSYDEAAGIVGVSRGTLASRVFRARNLLAAALAKKMGEKERR